MTDEQIKAAAKEAIKEWLDERFAEFGKWSLIGIASAALAMLAWGLIVIAGWHR